MKYWTKVRIKSWFYEWMEWVIVRERKLSDIQATFTTNFKLWGNNLYLVKFKDISEEFELNELEIIEDQKVKFTKIELWKETKQEYDFSKFVWRDWTNLAIKWNKFLESDRKWDIFYVNFNKHNFEDKISYTETTLDKLEVWDVFILQSCIKQMNLEDFEIFIWIDDEWYKRTQCLCEYDWIELIQNSLYFWNKKVIKFNRD